MLLRTCLIFLFSMCFSFTVTAAEEEGEPEEEFIAYVELKTFTANYGETTELHYVKCEITIQAGSAETEIAINEHLPSIRNDIIFLLMAQTQETMNTPTTQTSLARQATLIVQQRLIDEVGEEASKVTDLFFVSFVAQ